MAQMVESLRVASVDRGEVLRYLGYHGQELTPELEGRLDAVVERCLQTARPRACLRQFGIKERGKTADGMPEVVLDGCSLKLAGTSMQEHLQGAVAVGVMAVTIGADIERELRRLALVDPLEQVMFDAAATAVVERAADAAEARLVSLGAEQNLHANWRFSPGYGDLPLACQVELLASLDATRRLGITLTPSLLMVPTKSVTAVVGYFTEPRHGARPGCGTCNLREWCTIRAHGDTCHKGV